jgi:hypothetical protein
MPARAKKLAALRSTKELDEAYRDWLDHHIDDLSDEIRLTSGDLHRTLLTLLAEHSLSKKERKARAAQCKWLAAFNKRFARVAALEEEAERAAPIEEIARAARGERPPP